MTLSGRGQTREFQIEMPRMFAHDARPHTTHLQKVHVRSVGSQKEHVRAPQAWTVALCTPLQSLHFPKSCLFVQLQRRDGSGVIFSCVFL